MSEGKTEWAVIVDMSKIEGWDPDAPEVPWNLDYDKSFSDADGTSVRVHDEISLVEPLQFAEDWAPAPAGTHGTVDAFVMLPEGPVWLDLSCPGPGGATKAFARPSQVRFQRSREEWMAEAQARRDAWGR